MVTILTSMTAWNLQVTLKWNIKSVHHYMAENKIKSTNQDQEDLNNTIKWIKSNYLQKNATKSAQGWKEIISLMPDTNRHKNACCDNKIIIKQQSPAIFFCAAKGKQWHDNKQVGGEMKGQVSYHCTVSCGRFLPNDVALIWPSRLTGR